MQLQLQDANEAIDKIKKELFDSNQKLFNSNQRLFIFIREREQLKNDYKLSIHKYSNNIKLLKQHVRRLIQIITNNKLQLQRIHNPDANSRWTINRDIKILENRDACMGTERKLLRNIGFFGKDKLFTDLIMSSRKQQLIDTIQNEIRVQQWFVFFQMLYLRQLLQILFVFFSQ